MKLLRQVQIMSLRPDEESTSALKEIVKPTDIPITADIHFHYKRAIESAKNGASCLRINPGNIMNKNNIKEVIKVAKDHNCSLESGRNLGSLEKDILEKYKEPRLSISRKCDKKYKSFRR